MDKENKNIPQIRFPEFEGDWEWHRLGDLVVIERGGSPRPIDKFITNDENGLNWVKIGDAPEQGNYITKTIEKIKPEGLSKTREVHPGDLILSNSMSFGRPYIMAIDGCIHDGWLLIRDINGVFNLEFLCFLLGSEQMLNQYKSLAAGSTVNNLNKELVGNTNIIIPNLEEQQKIGSYFKQLDNLITLSEQELNGYKELKKSMIQKLFSQEVRFKRDDGSDYPDWDSIQFGDCIIECLDKINFNEESNDHLLSSTVNGVFKKNEYFNNDKRQDTTGYKILKKNQMVMSPQNLWMGNINVNTKYDYGYVSPSYKIFDFTDKLIPGFAKDFIKTHNMLCQYLLVSEQGASIVRRNTDINKFLEIPISIPKDIKEQTKIANCLSSYDNLIALATQELNEYKRLKKCMLQKMFC